MRIPLEDGYRDIVGKARRGLGISGEELPQGETDIRRLAATLRLGGDALFASAEQSWYPNAPGPINGLVCFNTPYEDFTVNSYLVFDPTTKIAAAFDTGSDCSGMLKQDAVIWQIFITHIHGDHIQDLARLAKETGVLAYVSEREQIAGVKAFKDGASFTIGSLKVETRRTSGHATCGVSYVISGLQRKLVIVADALFAGSMGGGIVSYEEALRTSRENILSLPDDTVICPGHGPLTTVGEEKKHNPFFAT
jgi:hydroxyacylglutathione hydrolase